jgi:hypothetical protein
MKASNEIVLMVQRLDGGNELELVEVPRLVAVKVRKRLLQLRHLLGRDVQGRTRELSADQGELVAHELLELLEGRFERRHRLARVRVVHLGHGEERICELLRGHKLLGALSRPGRIFLKLRLACMACGNRVRIVRRDE